MVSASAAVAARVSSVSVECSSAAKLRLVLADSERYFRQARAERMPEARAWVLEELDRRIALRREHNRMIRNQRLTKIFPPLRRWF